MSDQCHHRLLRSPDTFVVLPGAMPTDFRAAAGTPVKHLPGEIVMPATAMVDAALAGLDQGEFATVPSLPNLADWNAYEAAKQALMPNLSPAVRARTGESASWAHGWQYPNDHNNP